MLIVKELKQICLAAPSTWEGVDEKGQPVYIRYRHGELTVRVGDKSNGVIIFEEQLTYEDDPYLNFPELKAATKDRILFLDCENNELDELSFV